MALFLISFLPAVVRTATSAVGPNSAMIASLQGLDNIMDLDLTLQEQLLEI